MLVPWQRPETTAGPQLWLQQPGGSVPAITVNVLSGDVLGENVTGAAGPVSYGGAARLRVQLHVDNTAATVQFDWHALDDASNSYTSPLMPLAGPFHPSRLHIYLNSSQQHIRSAQGFDNIWLTSNRNQITTPAAVSPFVPTSPESSDVGSQSVGQSTADLIDTNISANRKAWVKQRLRDLPFMIGGVLEFDRWPGVVDLHPGVQSYLDAGFTDSSLFKETAS